MDEQLHDNLIVRIRQITQGVGGVVEAEKCLVRKEVAVIWQDR